MSIKAGQLNASARSVNALAIQINIMLSKIKRLTFWMLDTDSIDYTLILTDSAIVEKGVIPALFVVKYFT